MECETCQWWRPNKKDNDFGYCKVFPPTVFLAGQGRDGTPFMNCSNPSTHAKDYCGEYTAVREKENT